MSANLNFELVSPEERLVSGPVKMAVVPGAEGELGVGAGHSSFVVELQPGVVKLYAEGDAMGVSGAGRKIFVAGGFADISSAGCSVLAEEAIPLEDLSADDLQQQVQNLNEDLGMAVEASDKVRILKKLKMAEAKLFAVQRS